MMKHREISRWLKLGTEIIYLNREYSSDFGGWLFWTDSEERSYGFFTHGYIEDYHEISDEEVNMYPHIKKYKLENL